MSDHKSGGLDVLITTRVPAGRYAHVVSQANMLVEHGLAVAIVEVGRDGRAEPGAFHPQVERLVAPDLTSSHPHVAWKRWRNAHEFSRLVQRTVVSRNPAVVVSSDIDGSLALTPFLNSGRPRTVLHFSELPDPRIGVSWIRRQRILHLLRIAHKADLIVQPDPYRLAVFRADTNLTSAVAMVPNCPRRTESVDPRPARDDLERTFGKNHRIVMHVGATSPGRGLLETVRSMPLWPADAVLAYRGLVYPEFAARLSAEARDLGMGDRLLIQDVSNFQPDALAYIAAADLGIAFHESLSLNQLYSAFASQKLHQYMAAGVPILARRGPGFDELVFLAGCGLCVDVTSPEEIGQTVNRMLADEELLRRCGRNGRRLHLNWFNYERQFAPVLSQILEWCGREPLQLAAKTPATCLQLESPGGV